MKALAGVCVSVAVLLGLSAWLGSERASGSATRSSATLLFRSEPWIARGTVRSSVLLLGGRLRCTASVGSEVQAGQPVRVRFALHNYSKRSVVVPGPVWLAVRAADGTTYDTETDPNARTWTGGASDPVPAILIRPRATSRLSFAVPVRWRGPLQITPGCVKALSALSVEVTSPGAPSDANAAVTDVVAAAEHLLDQCRPQTPGVPVEGLINPPSADAPPMSAQCSVFISSRGAFWVAQVVILSPPGVLGLPIVQPYETLWQPGLPPPTLSPPFEEIAWEFVVTREGASPIAAATAYAINPSHQMAPLWYWSGTGWQLAGTGPCGGSDFVPSAALGTIGPYIAFIGGCSVPRVRFPVPTR
jgi:hypothetical protein